ncbi:diguanylate cyclase [Deferribacterales bacterium Es71-Z0220]|uniref:diguanylate cyclase n=1 Tax=Deferrivibrio essentukiensis TaxID=2880922 RepID=UPI001F6026B3|nr:diguanylate cyclase [Deferrivibrio essentukiensis]MCB4203989.1 diguanylate cyclase [Deferrivibrio essentukiensis]
MKKYILIADPSKLSRFLLESLLQDKYGILSVSSYSEAIDVLKETLPSLAIVSYELKDGQGVELCKYMKNDDKLKNVPVIVLSSNEDEKTRITVYEDGAIDFVPKSKINEEFAKYIDELMDLLSLIDVRSATAFVVDDSIVQLKFIENILKSVGVDVTLFTDPKELIASLENTIPDVIISDLYMDDIDGIKLTKFLRKNKKLKHVPIIIQTSSRDGGILRTLMIHGANDYILKPYSAEELLLKFTTAYKSKKLYDELEETNRKLFTKATIDALTGIYNRRFFMEQFQFMLLNAKRYEQDLGFIILDIDNFKNINDTYGHSCGDEVLINLAKCLKLTLRQTDIVGRFGGEEFVCLLPNITKNGFFMVLKKLLNNIRNLEVTFEDKTLQFTVSVGAVNCLNCNNIDDIIKSADSLLYKAKTTGKDKAFLEFDGDIIELT